MDKEKVLTQLAAGRQELEGRDAQAMNNVFRQVWSGELTIDMELATVLQGRFENTPAWDAVLRDLYHEIVDEQVYLYRPKTPEPEPIYDMRDNPVSHKMIAQIAARILYGFIWQETEEGSTFWGDAYGALEAWASTHGFDVWDYWGDVKNYNHDPEALREASNMLSIAFVWADTEEGYQYWLGVYLALRKNTRRLED